MAPFDQADFPLPVVNPADSDPVLRALVGGRAAIEDPANWLKDDGFMYGSDCPQGMCAYNATARAAFNNMDVYNSAAHYLQRALPKPHECVAMFNDDPTTTHADVLALFDRAIAERRNASKAA